MYLIYYFIQTIEIIQIQSKSRQDPYLRMKNVQLNSIVGKGSQSTVYQTNKIDQFDIVVKLTTDHHQALAKEFHILKILQGYHGFPKIFCFDCSEGVSYLAMQRLGYTLTDYLSEFSTLPTKTVMQIGLQLINRLEVLHRAGFVHSDIKPSNVIFSIAKTSLYLIDFGLTLKIGSSRSEEVFKGNIMYSSVNQMKCGTSRIMDDIESFFYLIYRLLCGGLPWSDVGDSLSVQVFERTKCKKEYVNWDIYPWSNWMKKAFKIKKSTTKNIYQKIRKLLKSLM